MCFDDLILYILFYLFKDFIFPWAQLTTSKLDFIDWFDRNACRDMQIKQTRESLQEYFPNPNVQFIPNLIKHS